MAKDDTERILLEGKHQYEHRPDITAEGPYEPGLNTEGYHHSLRQAAPYDVSLA